MEQASSNPGTADGGTAPLPPVLRLEALRLPADGDTSHGPVTLDVAASEVVSLVGSAKAAASALLRSVAGLAEPLSGRIEIRGTRPRLGHSAVGISFADPMLLEWRSAIDNVLLQAEIRRLPRGPAAARARRLLAVAGVADREKEKPERLSPAEAQRVAVCRALLHEPALLVMEEPFLGLDALEREQMCQDLERLLRETGVAVVTATSQIFEAALLSDRLAVFVGEPAGIQEVVAIDLPRPRRWDREQTARLTEVAGRVRTLLRAQGALV